MGYQVPKAPVSIELEEKRSRFITFLQPVQSRAEALAFVESLRVQYPDARHHCWAYVVGNPRSPREMAASDDGEPSGTAGKPILQVLQFRQIGDIAAVVVRYFGGIRLGAGGLVRAYSSSVQQAVEQLLLTEKISYAALKLQCTYPCEAIVRHLLESVEGQILQQNYSEQVILSLELPVSQQAHFLQQLTNQASGQFQLLEH